MTPPPDTPSLFEDPGRDRPLAARMRPRRLDEYEGQQHLLAAGRPLRQALARQALGSMILWGPPGSGKTTLARLLAAEANLTFVPFSAVSEGVPRLRRIFEEAQERRARGASGTLLFVDEIHRLNKAQQDSLLPAVEEGIVTLVGATTENPSFEINGALLSRARVFVLQPLDPAALERILDRAIGDPDRGVAESGLSVERPAIQLLAETADGDARRALTALEAAAALAGPGGTVTTETVRDALQRRVPRYDKGGEEHFNVLSAYHKSLRGSDPQAALYWMARMLEGGEDPMTIFRRAIAMAAEDIGVADPGALSLAVAARDAFHMLGPPEGYLPLAEMTIYLATAPKSNSVKRALDAAMEAARETPAAPVPLHIRNAPTALMRELGYHAGYQYAHDDPAAYIPQEYLPAELSASVFYTPGPFGHERRIAERLEWWRKLRDGPGDAAGGDAPG